jgi:hypothetical protein
MRQMRGMSHFDGTNSRLRYIYQQRRLSSWLFVGFLQTLPGFELRLPAKRSVLQPQNTASLLKLL